MQNSKRLIKFDINPDPRRNEMRARRINFQASPSKSIRIAHKLQVPKAIQQVKPNITRKLSINRKPKPLPTLICNKTPKKANGRNSIFTANTSCQNSGNSSETRSLNNSGNAQTLLNVSAGKQLANSRTRGNFLPSPQYEKAFSYKNMLDLTGISNYTMELPLQETFDYGLRFPMTAATALKQFKDSLTGFE